MSRDDECYRSSFKFSVIFLNVLPYVQNYDDDDANADADADDDADAKHDNDSDDVFLNEDVPRFMVPGIIPFANSYVW